MLPGMVTSASLLSFLLTGSLHQSNLFPIEGGLLSLVGSQKPPTVYRPGPVLPGWPSVEIGRCHPLAGTGSDHWRGGPSTRPGRACRCRRWGRTHRGSPSSRRGAVPPPVPTVPSSSSSPARPVSRRTSCPRSSTYMAVSGASRSRSIPVHRCSWWRLAQSASLIRMPGVIKTTHCACRPGTTSRRRCYLPIVLETLNIWAKTAASSTNKNQSRPSRKNGQKSEKGAEATGLTPHGAQVGAEDAGVDDVAGETACPDGGKVSKKQEKK